jgi:hypothetical protein
MKNRKIEKINLMRILLEKSYSKSIFLISKKYFFIYLNLLYNICVYVLILIPGKKKKIKK